MIDKQIEREEESARSGFKRFQKLEQRNEVIGNASSNAFGVSLLTARHDQITKNIYALIDKNLGSKCVPIKEALSQCFPKDLNGNEHNLVNIDVWGYLGFKETLDNLFNKNQQPSGKTAGKFGGDKNLTMKKSLSELELSIGKLIRNEMSLALIKEVFPKWFRVNDKFAKHSFEGAIRSSPQGWNTKMSIALTRFANKLEAQGDKETAEFVRRRKIWSDEDCRVIGELIVAAVMMATPDILTTHTYQIGKKKRTDIVLSPMGEQIKGQLEDEVKKYSSDLLPMLTEPIPLTNEQLGGWLTPALQEKEHSRKGSIELSDKHQEFINRQMRVKFEINPFTHDLIKRLVDEGKSLGKFVYEQTNEVPSARQLLGITTKDPTESDKQWNKIPKDKRVEARRASARLKNDAFKKGMHNVISTRIVQMVETLAKDECFYIPMKNDFRGRVYSRVPFLSFQGTDAGKYLLRFHKKTPADDYTLKWFKRGIANAAGQDKKSWEEREAWFDRNITDIITVGKMLKGENFSNAYDYLRSDNIDDPFCFAALANEYVKVFVDKTQDYTQCFVTIDASCSGTSIFNAWRLNASGARKTNLINTPAPADIYMEVWQEIKRMLPERSIRQTQIKRVEASKLLRKMMKTTYVPASYASPKGEQLIKLKAFNDEHLKPANIGFNDKEMQAIQGVWAAALDKVSSINTVVDWFRTRTKEAINAGSTSITVTNSVGSQMTLRYPKTNLKKVGVIGNPEARTRRKSIHVDTDSPDLKKMLSSVTANVTHFTDASALVEALWDCQMPFVAIHDAVGYPIGKDIEDGLVRLREGLHDATKHSIWDSFLNDNNLPHNHLTAAPIIGDLILEDIKTSNYMFS